VTDSEAEKIQHLMRALKQATTAGRIKWRATDNYEFQYSTVESSIVLKARDHDGAEPYVMQLFDGKGFVVESVETLYGDEGARLLNEILEDLYVSARRSALNIDNVIDSLMRSLDPNKPTWSDEPPF
jgi:hypothetical protein